MRCPILTACSGAGGVLCGVNHNCWVALTRGHLHARFWRLLDHAKVLEKWVFVDRNEAYQVSVRLSA